MSSDTVRLAALGAAYPLSATVSDANGMALAGATVTWSSTDESVATVDGAGRVEAVGVGETEVTASAGDASDAATVIVDQSAASVSVSPALSELHAIGDSASLSAIVRDANGNAIDGAAVEWTSADEGVATVDGGGWAFAQANGTAAITAAVGEISDDAAVVVEQRVASVQVSPAADSVGEGDAVQLDAVAADANGAEVAGRTVVWTTSDPAAASVDGSGNVTGVVRGADATITATVDGVSGTADVHVLDQIAFLSHRDGAYDDIFIMNADGSGQTNVTNDVAVDLEPAWSPNGSKIAFERRNGDAEIWAVNIDGSDPTNLTNDAANDFLPVWSPDGSEIAFRSLRDGNAEVYVMNADGSDPTNLTNDAAADLDPAWSPDGTMIAFSSNRDGDYEIYVMDADGSNQTRLTNSSADDRHAAWSPDGTQIAFERSEGSDEEIWVVNADGSGVRNLSESVDDSDLVWRPRP